MNIHPDDPKWTAYVLGELDDAERAEVERELESSVEAREIVDEIRMMTSLLQDELAREAPLSLLPEQRNAIHAAVQEPRRAWAWPKWAFAGAGTLAAALILWTVVVPNAIQPPAPMQSTMMDEATARVTESKERNAAGPAGTACEER
jgi:anti-sigma factor RsiW